MDQAEVQRLIRVKYDVAKPEDGRDWYVDPNVDMNVYEMFEVIGAGTFARVIGFRNFDNREVRPIGRRFDKMLNTAKLI